MKSMLVVAIVLVCVSLLLLFLTPDAPVKHQPRQPQVIWPSSTLKQTIEIPSWGNNAPSLLIDLSSDVRLTKKHGPDFDVYFFSRTPGARMGIYIGHNPDPGWPTDAKPKKAKIGDHDVTWYFWQEKRNGSTHHFRETVVEGFFGSPVRVVPLPLPLPPKPPPPPGPPPPPPPPPTGLDTLTIHVFIGGTDANEVNSLWESASTIRLKR